MDTLEKFRDEVLGHVCECFRAGLTPDEFGRLTVAEVQQILDNPYYLHEEEGWTVSCPERDAELVDNLIDEMRDK